MSDFLRTLLRRSRAPIPEAVRPAPRARFEPEGAYGISQPTEALAREEDSPPAGVAPPREPLDRSAGRAAAPAGAGIGGRAPSDVHATPAGPPERSPAAPRAPTGPIVEPSRTIRPEPHPLPAGSASGGPGLRTAPAAGTGAVMAERGDSSATAAGAAQRPAPAAARRADPAPPAPTQVRAAPSVAAEPHDTAVRTPRGPTPLEPPGPAERLPIVEPARLPRAASNPPSATSSVRALTTAIPPLQPVNVQRRPPEDARAEGRGGASAPPPPAITVTIGRVEVRAVTPPAPPSRPVSPPARPREPALALSDYLAQRARGGR